MKSLLLRSLITKNIIKYWINPSQFKLSNQTFIYESSQKDTVLHLEIFVHLNSTENFSIQALYSRTGVDTVGISWTRSNWNAWRSIWHEINESDDRTNVPPLGASHNFACKWGILCEPGAPQILLFYIAFKNIGTSFLFSIAYFS